MVNQGRTDIDLHCCHGHVAQFSGCESDLYKAILENIFVCCTPTHQFLGWIGR